MEANEESYRFDESLRGESVESERGKPERRRRKRGDNYYWT